MVTQILKLLYHLLALRFRRHHQSNILLVAEFGKTGGTRTYFFYLMEFLYKQKANVTLLVNGSAKDDEVLLVLKKYNFKTLETNFDFWCTDLNNISNGLTKKQQFQYELKELSFWCDTLRKYNFRTIVFSHHYPGKYLSSF